MIRDFTYIDDVVKAIVKVAFKAPSANTTSKLKDNAPYQLFNVGNSNPINLLDYIDLLEEILEKKVKKDFLPLPVTDSIRTSSDNELLEDFIKFKPNTSIRKGVNNFVNWYKCYYNI